MIRAVAVALAIAVPMQANALSCAPRFVQDAYQDAADSPDPYVVVIGNLQFDTKQLPKVDWANQQDAPQKTLIPGRLIGQSLAQDGFSQPFRSDVTVIVTCAGPWCAKPAPGESLAFLKRTDAGYEALIGPCGGFLFGAPDAAMRNAVEQCFSTGECSPPEY